MVFGVTKSYIMERLSVDEVASIKKTATERLKEILIKAGRWLVK